MKLIYNIVVKLTLLILIITVGISAFGGMQDSQLFIELSKQTAEIGTLLLYLMLAAKSLYFIFKKSDISKDNSLFKFLQENTKYQREQGLIVFNILFIHCFLATLESLGSINTLLFNYFTVLIPTLILIYMEFTSFRYFQKKIKKWKKSHTVIWVTLPLIVLHVILVSDSFIKYLFLTLILFVIAITEILLDIKKGKRHISYLGIGFILAIAQFSASKFYLNSQTTLVAENTDNSLNVDDSATTTTTASETASEVVSDTTSEVSADTVSDVTTEVSNNVYQDGTFTGEGFGHHGRSIVVDTTIKDDTIIDIEVVSQSEDAQWWQPVADTIPAAIISNNSTEGVSYVAGSTHSSQGLIDAVDNSLENAKVTTENTAV